MSNDPSTNPFDAMTTIDAIHDYITRALDGVVSKNVWGETAYFYNPGNVFDRGAYFATVKTKDGENDKASRLDRAGVWRINMGVSRRAYFELFGPPPPRPRKGGVIEGGWSFTELDQISPHPVYGWMSWIAALNPSESTWAKCVPLLATAHARAEVNFNKRLNRQR